MYIISAKGTTLLEIINQVEKSLTANQTHFGIHLSIKEIEKFGYATFIDLAQSFHLRFLTPKVESEDIMLYFESLNQDNSFHASSNSREKYGVKSNFFQIHKEEKFSFLYYYIESIKHAKIKERKRILNLGINRGDEFAIINQLYPEKFKTQEYIGIDFSQTAIEYARKSFATYQNCRFYCEDINRIDNLKLGKFDMLISIGTLQSSTLNLKTTLMHLVQNYLNKDATIILGFPNCRWIDGEMIYGARVPNYNFSELGTVIKDIYFCKKYLQQKRFRVTITGKDYLFLTATSIRKAES